MKLSTLGFAVTLKKNDGTHEEMLRMQQQLIDQKTDQMAANAERNALRQHLPTESDAIAAGVTNCSYNTVNCGYVESYRGEAEFTFCGVEYRAIGHHATGSADYACPGHITLLKKIGGAWVAAEFR